MKMNYFIFKVLFSFVLVSFSLAASEQVFLGGSCDPTTWRKDIAIPEFENRKITYYNPQKSPWREEYIEQENIAKKNAAVLFFVIDSQTRASASIVEVGFIAGKKQKSLVLVKNDFTAQSCKFSREECGILYGGRKMLRDVVDKKRIPIFAEIMPGIDCTAEVLKTKQTPEFIKKCTDLAIERNKPRKDENIQILDGIYGRDGSIGKDVFYDPKKGVYILGVVDKNANHPWPATYKQEKYSITFANQHLNNNKKAILFVIDKSSTDNALMVLAAYYMGMGYNVILCLENIPENSNITPFNGMNGPAKINAIKDYNRGRTYLNNYAGQYKIPVENNLKKCFEVAEKKAK